MLVVVSDTHRREGHGLEGRTLEAVRGAEAVVHAGDFTTAATLDAFEAKCPRLYAVFGNNDEPAVRDRLPARVTFEAEELRVVVVHGHEHDSTALSLLGREEEADLVVFGHSHRPEVRTGGPATILNPGSHAQPRWHRPGHAEIEDGRGRLCEPDGTLLYEFELGQ